MKKIINSLLLLLCGFMHPANSQIIDLRNGEEISEQVLADRLRTQDIVLLGELHDNAQHHALRARLLARFASSRTTVVAEHLPASSRVRFDGALQSDLEAAGFDVKGWAWPVHQPLFDGIRAQGLALVGGNLPKGFSKQLMTKGADALAAPLAAAYRGSPLSAEAVQRLDDDLVAGHCGQLPARYLPQMRLVQRAADVSMADALLSHQPSVLLAGNGHVRKDYGVPQVLRALASGLKVAAVGFDEDGVERKELVKSLAGRYDYVWLTARAERSDPCEGFQLK
jgi:uncharacterized iron-regulated protein